MLAVLFVGGTEYDSLKKKKKQEFVKNVIANNLHTFIITGNIEDI